MFYYKVQEKTRFGSWNVLLWLIYSYRVSYRHVKMVDLMIDKKTNECIIVATGISDTTKFSPTEPQTIFANNRRIKKTDGLY